MDSNADNANCKEGKKNGLRIVKLGKFLRRSQPCSGWNILPANQCHRASFPLTNQCHHVTLPVINHHRPLTYLPYKQQGWQTVDGIMVP